MNTLKAGFGRVNVTPTKMGISIAGYFIPRHADGALDELEINAMTLEAGGNKVMLMTVDSCSVSNAVLEPSRRQIEALTGVPFESIFISLTVYTNISIM